MSKEMRDGPQFYLTAASPCPYLPEREERKVFTHLIGMNAKALNNSLTHAGFRRSQTIAYRPACEHCRACVSVRVLAKSFVPSRSFRRVQERNSDLVVEGKQSIANDELYDLFQTYLNARHHDGGMIDMGYSDFITMLEDTHVESRVVEYRQSDTKRLMGVCLTDVLSDGLSMVYSFYDPAEDTRSLGTHMILDHIERTRRLNLPYLYLGYWIEGSRKMAYKARFHPQQRLQNGAWHLVDHA